MVDWWRSRLPLDDSCPPPFFFLTDVSIDVGVDTNDFYPYSLDDVMEKLRIIKLKMSGDVYRVKIEHKRCEQEET